MLDKLSKNVLTHLNTHSEQPSHENYNFGEDLDLIASALHADSEAVRAAIRYLQKLGYVKYYSVNGRVIYFGLDHKGLHWKEFRWYEVLKYLRDNWISFFAMIASVASLILSLIALLRP